MTNLNEDVLRLIFDYLDTPLDWVQVSEVCTLWKVAASKQWRTSSNLKIDEEEQLSDDEENNFSVIPFKDAKRMVFCAAPFVQVLSGSTKSSRLEDLIISFGSFRYKVRGRAVVLLELLAQNATKITEISFKYPPETKLLNIFIRDNNIKKVTVAESNAFFEHIPTEKIEELSIHFKKPKFIKSFTKLFPNLKNLDLEVNLNGVESPSMLLKQKLSLILPYVHGLTSFQLHLSSRRPIHLKDVCSDIMKLPQLENLSLMFIDSKVTSLHLFLNELPIGCPQLRAVKIDYETIYEKELGILLNLPNLESLDVSTVESFRTLELPQIIKLSELRIKYDDANLNETNFAGALKMMPKMKRLHIEKTLAYIFVETYISNSLNRTPNLIFEVAKVAALQEKDVVVRDAWKTHSNELRIANKNVHLEVETMTVLAPFSRKTDFLERIKELVDNNLKSHYAVIVKDE